MVQAQAVFGASGASVQVKVEGDPVPPTFPIPLPVIIGGIALLGIIVVAVILKK